MVDTYHPIVHFDPVTSLAAALTSGDTTGTVRHPTKFGASATAWLCESEVVYAWREGVSETINFTRAQEGTTAAAHALGAALTAMSPTEEINRIVNVSALPLTSPALTTPTLITPTLSGALKDTSGVNRLIANPTAKTIVDGSATSLFEVAIAAASYAAGTVHFAVFASDGTDHQAISGILTYSGENKAGTIVRAATYVAANEAKSVSSGTLTLAFTATDDTNKMTVKLQPTGSLTETTYTILYTVYPIKGTVTIL